MSETTIYSERFFDTHDRMRDIVFSNPCVLPALSRFNIPLGFGESMVSEVCHANKVDSQTFLSVINFITGHPYSAFKVNLDTLINYLKSAHDYYLNYLLPSIRLKLIQAISTGVPGDFTFLIVRHFDKYIEELRQHLSFEEEKVFPYVESLLNNTRGSNYSIIDFKSTHQPMVGKLTELKELFIGHFTASDGRVDLLNSVLADIISLESDLQSHCSLEDLVFVPSVVKLESKVRETIENENKPESTFRDPLLDQHGDVILTNREREIVASIALGLSNKEIADKMCLSIHTVTTHRRNISTKLNLHSSSSITLYAVMHGIISLDEVK